MDHGRFFVVGRCSPGMVCQWRKADMWQAGDAGDARHNRTHAPVDPRLSLS
jgi:hypothetical protein